MKNRVWKGCLLIFLVGLVAVGGCAVVATSPRYRRTPLGHLSKAASGQKNFNSGRWEPSPVTEVER
jgi:hypothetical protein